MATVRCVQPSDGGPTPKPPHPLFLPLRLSCSIPVTTYVDKQFLREQGSREEYRAALAKTTTVYVGNLRQGEALVGLSVPLPLSPSAAATIAVTAAAPAAAAVVISLSLPHSHPPPSPPLPRNAASSPRKISWWRPLARLATSAASSWASTDTA